MNIKTGDLLLFKGNSPISRLITAMPGAEYSHVGFVFNHYVFGACVFESTSIGNDPDILTGEIIKGVQITPYEDRIRNYDGEVFIKPLSDDLTEGQIEAFQGYIDENHGKPYEEDNLELARAELDFLPWHRNKADESTLFCSELAASLLRNIGVIDVTDQPTNEFTPTDFSEDVKGYDPIMEVPLKNEN